MAEIDALEPAFPVPDDQGRDFAEALDQALHMLGLDDLHELLWHGYEHSRLTNPQAALWSERTAVVLADWLRDHSVPRLTFWYPSRISNCFVLFKLTASKS